jgi:hypothetical protein
MNKIPGMPGGDLQQRMLAEAQREVKENESRAAKFSTVGSASDGSGDLIMIGHTNLNLTTVAIRISTIQALAICANVCGALSASMNQAQAELKALGHKRKPE